MSVPADAVGGSEGGWGRESSTKRKKDTKSGEQTEGFAENKGLSFFRGLKQTQFSAAETPIKAKNSAHNCRFVGY